MQAVFDAWSGVKTLWPTEAKVVEAIRGSTEQTVGRLVPRDWARGALQDVKERVGDWEVEARKEGLGGVFSLSLWRIPLVGLHNGRRTGGFATARTFGRGGIAVDEAGSLRHLNKKNRGEALSSSGAQTLSTRL